jgi:hypothetical protein
MVRWYPVVLAVLLSFVSLSSPRDAAARIWMSANDQLTPDFNTMLPCGDPKAGQAFHIVFEPDEEPRSAIAPAAAHALLAVLGTACDLQCRWARHLGLSGLAG